MPGSKTLVVARMPAVTGDPDDAAVLDFVFQDTLSATPTAGATNAMSAASAFLTATYVGSKYGDFVSPEIDRGVGVCTLTPYDISAHLDGSPHGNPVTTPATFSLSAAGALVPIPPQAAVHLATRASYGTAVEKLPGQTIPSTEAAIDQGAPATHPGVARPRGRRRGGFFLGPFNLNVNGNAGAPTYRSVPSTPFANWLNAAAMALIHQTINPPDPPVWCIWSRRDAALYPVVLAYFEDKFQTIRRRELDKTFRNIIT